MKYLIKRFVSYYIDAIIINVLSWIFLILHRIFILGIEPNNIKMPDGTTQMLFILATMVVYFFLFELLFGKTIGKIILKLKVTGIEEITSHQKALRILVRTILRLNPLDGFSIFLYEDNSAWHDRVSKTRVVEVINKK